MMHISLSKIILFLQMGGYGRYVWPVYIFAAVVVSLSIYFPWQQRKKLLKKLGVRSHSEKT